MRTVERGVYLNSVEDLGIAHQMTAMDGEMALERLGNGPARASNVEVQIF
jgi:hypothetical protein